MLHDLFADDPSSPVRFEAIGPGSHLLHGFALAAAASLWKELAFVIAAAPFRHMQTPGGYRMSVAMSNCGDLGWVTDRAGYRYATTDPLSGLSWPLMPDSFRKLARSAAESAGFPGFAPDACLINRYEPGSKMALHQDKDECDLSAPIVSVSLGLPAVFQFGGLERKDRPEKILLEHGDVLVWGGPDRLRFHGILPLKAGEHPLCGNYRINLTFRKAS